LNKVAYFYLAAACVKNYLKYGSLQGQINAQNLYYACFVWLPRAVTKATIKLGPGAGEIAELGKML
jgi:hypothetical protein